MPQESRLARPVLLTVADIFSGIGGFSLAARRAGFKTTLLCEIEPFSQHVLRQNFPNTPIIEDVYDLNAETYRKAAKEDHPTVLTAGFPFQANYSRGEYRRNDPRSLWDELVRVVESLRPAWIVAETVPRFEHLGLDDALWDLERAGYAAHALYLPSQAFDAPTRKDRLYLVGALNSRPGHPGRKRPDSALSGWETLWPPPESGLHRLAVGIPGGVDFHEAAANAYGDATIPRQAEAVLRYVREVEELTNENEKG